MRTFDRGQCERRNKVAAKRDGINAVPFRFLADFDSRSPITARGVLPTTEEAQLLRINALLPENSALLTADQVYIHRLEAANSNFISDRFMFLDPSTLRNIADEANKGVAFMNSHRTGAVSTPSELPMGKTFAGRYELHGSPDGGRDHRSLMLMYMRRGIQPNGANGPSTDDLHQMIEGGTVSDVSVGLYGGVEQCDVCGNELFAWEKDDDGYYRPLCPHLPGTHRKMTEEEKDAQKARGVPDGLASYSLVDAHLGEVSAVFDGAVPGAGFQKALRLSRGRMMTPQDTAQARHAYARLLSKGDLSMDVDDIVAEIGRRFGIRPRDYTRDDPPPPTNTLPAGDGGEAEQLRQKLAATEAQLAAERSQREAEERKRLETAAEAFASSVVQSRKLMPYQKPSLQSYHLQMALDDRRDPASIVDHTGEILSRVAMLEKLMNAGSEQHKLTEPLLPVTAPKDAVALGSQSTSELDEIRQLREQGRQYAEQRNARDRANASGKGLG